jgi:hypothetical protein
MLPIVMLQQLSHYAWRRQASDCRRVHLKAGVGCGTTIIRVAPMRLPGRVRLLNSAHPRSEQNNSFFLLIHVLVIKGGEDQCR